jgi:hypothetical protein
MRRTLAIMAIVLSLSGAHASRVLADGGRLAIVDRQGDLRVSVFTLPNPLRAGPVDISVLLQNAHTDQPIRDAQVSVNAKLRDNTRRQVYATASRAAATNKLMQAALFDLPEPGLWDVDVTCRTGDRVLQTQFAMDAGQPLPNWISVWSWFTWPLGVVLIFGVHRLLVWRRHYG